MSVQVSYKKQGIFAIVLLLVILVTIEIASTIWWYGQINCEFENNEIFQQMSSSEKYQLCTDLHSIRTSGMELIPDQETQSITINSFGFRGDDFSSNKPENIFRIFMLGGSTMFGYGATSNFTTIPGYFEDILQRNTEFYEIQVINAGIQGADSYDELILLENKILGFDPDMIIVYDGWNDLRSQNTSEDVSNNWNQMCELTQKNNLEILIMLQPIAGFGNKPLTENESKFASVGTDYDGRPLIDSYKKYNKYAESLFELKNCENVFDLRFIFDEIKGPIYWDQGHISDNGNEIVANKMAENIPLL